VNSRGGGGVGGGVGGGWGGGCGGGGGGGVGFGGVTSTSVTKGRRFRLLKVKSRNCGNSNLRVGGRRTLSKGKVIRGLRGAIFKGVPKVFSLHYSGGGKHHWGEWKKT